MPRPPFAESTPPGPPPLSVHAQLMQNYVNENALAAGQARQVVTDRSGRLAIFIVGSRGRIYSIRAMATPTDWLMSWTGLASRRIQGAPFAAGLDDDGRLVVAVPNEWGGVNFVVEAPNDSWGTPARVTLRRNLCAVGFRRIAQQLWLVAHQCPLQGGPPFRPNMGLWKGADTQLTIQGLAQDTLEADAGWVGDEPGLLQVITNSPQQSAVDFVTGPDQHSTLIAGANPILKLAVAEDPAGQSQVFAIFADQHVYFLDRETGTTPASWVCLDSSAIYGDLHATLGDEGRFQLFGLGRDGFLRQIRQEPDLPSSPTNAAGWGPATVLSLGSGTGAVSAIALTSAGAAPPRLVAVAETGGDAGLGVFVVRREPDTGLWDTAELHGTSEGLAEIETYSLDIVIADPSGKLYPETEVMLFAEDPIDAVIGGRAYRLGPRTAVQVKSNVAGRLSLILETNTLHCPVLKLWGPWMPAGDRIAIEPNQYIQEQLEGLTETELAGAKMADGKPLLGPYATDTKAVAAVQQAVVLAMRMARPNRVCSCPPRTPPPPSTPAPAPSEAPALSLAYGARVSYRADDCGCYPTRIDPALIPAQSWRLDSSSGTPVFTELTRAQALAEIDQDAATHAAPMGLLAWFGSLGDLLSEAAAGVVSIVKTVVSAAADGIHAAITFVVDNVPYLFRAGLHLIEEVIGLVETVFHLVKVGFQKLFAWLGRVFHWTQVNYARQAIEHAILKGVLPFASGALGTLKGIVDTGFSSFESQVANGFDKAIAGFGGGNTSLLGYQEEQAPLSPAQRSALGNNLILGGLLDHAGAVRMTGPWLELSLDDESPMAKLYKFLGEQGELLEGTPDSADLLTYLESQTKSADQLARSAIATLLTAVKAVALAFLQGLYQLVDKLIGLLQQALKSVAGLLTQEWHVPVLSTLWSKYVATDNAPLTALGLVALAIALPADLMHRAMFDGSLFKEQSDLDGFRDAFTGNWLLQMMNGGGAGLGAEAPSVVHRKKVALASGVILTVTYATLGVLNTAVDYQFVTSPPPWLTLIFASAIASWIRWAFGAPWALNPSNTVGAHCTRDPVQFGNTAWACFWFTPLAGTCMAFVALAASRNHTPLPLMPEVSAWIFTATGLVQLALAAVAWGFDKPPYYRSRSEVFVSFLPVFLKCLRTKFPVERTKKFSLYTLMFLDVGCWTLTSLWLRADLLKNPEPPRTDLAAVVPG